MPDEQIAMKWYVGAMNDTLFIIDQPPRPSADYISPNQDVNVIARISDPSKTGDAHARLIAAAPDLLEACQAWAAWDEDAHADDIDAARLRRMVAAAIAKATGTDA